MIFWFKWCCSDTLFVVLLSCFKFFPNDVVKTIILLLLLAFWARQTVLLCKFMPFAWTWLSTLSAVINQARFELRCLRLRKSRLLCNRNWMNLVNSYPRLFLSSVLLFGPSTSDTSMTQLMVVPGLRSVSQVNWIASILWTSEMWMGFSSSFSACYALP